MSSPRKTKVPAIPEIGPTATEVTAALSALKEATEVGHGRRGDPLDRFVTVRDLGDAGIAKPIGGGAGGSVSIVAVTAPPGSGPPGAPIFNPGAPDFGANDYTPPPAPTNVSVHHIAPNGFMVTWDPPGYHNHDHAEVFRMLGADASGNPIVPVFQLAAPGFDPTKPVSTSNMHPNFAGRATSTIYTDQDLTRTIPPSGNPLDNALSPVSYYYWVRFVSTANVVGPYAPLLGAAGALSIDPSQVLGLLIGNIQLSPIYHSLLGYAGSGDNPILAAGGVSPYIAQQNNLLHGQITQQIVSLIGTPPVGDTNSVWADIETIQANATATSATLNDIHSWQAALSTAAAPAGATAPAIGNFGYSRPSFDPGTIYIFETSYTAGVTDVPAGSVITVNAPTGSPLVSLNGKTFTTTVGSPGLFEFPAPVGSVVPTNDGSVTPCPGATVTLASSGVAGNFVNDIASIFKNVYVNVDPNTAIARAITDATASIGSLTTEVAAIQTAQQNIDGTFSDMWSVNMRSVGATGLVSAAGFGLGMGNVLNPDGTFTTTSTFLINANQFAVMGTNLSGAIITGASLGGNVGTVTLSDPNHGIKPPDATTTPPTRSKAVFAIAPTTTPGPQPPPQGAPATTNPLAGIGLDGMEVWVEGVTGATVSISYEPVLDASGKPIAGAFPAVTQSGLLAYGNALMPATNIPFVIDTTRNVVGIRGKLIVDGLIRATTGDFNTLTANTAFIQTLQANIVNANLIVGQRIVAGVPTITSAGGALDNSYFTTGDPHAISNYIIEMNAPTASGASGLYPLRYWNPSTGVSNFALDRLGNLGVGGNLSVGGNGVIQTTGTNLFSIGGAGSDGSQYPLWIGPQGNYGNSGAGRSETNGFIWAKDNGRVGINAGAQVFLGDYPLTIPDASGNVTVLASRSGGNTTVFVSANIGILCDGDGTAGTTDLGALLFLVSSNFSGPGAGAGTRVTKQAGIDNYVGWYPGVRDAPPPAPSAYKVCSAQFDYKGSDMKNLTVQGAVSVPAGNYKAFVQVWPKTADGVGNETAITGSFFATVVR